MSAPSFTPGPWVASAKKRGGWNVLGADGELRYVAVVDDDCYFYTPPVNEANARLIAAAPELYEALSEARLFVDLVMMRARREGDDEQSDEAEAALEDINRLLAKARGEVA